MAKKKASKKVTKKVTAKKEEKVVEKVLNPDENSNPEPQVVENISEKKDNESAKVVVEEPKKTKSEDLPEGLKVIKNKNGMFIETSGQGWVKLTKGQVMRLAEIIAE